MTQPRSSLSNRKGTCPKNGHCLVPIGVDRLSLTFPLEDFDREPTVWGDHRDRNRGWPTRQETWTENVEVRKGVSVHVGVQSMPPEVPYRYHARLDFNPSRILEPEGHGLCSVEDSPAAVALALGAALRLIKPKDSDPAAARMTRVDLSKDFEGVEDPSGLLRGLSTIPRSWARLNMIHADPKKNGAETVMIGSGAGVVRGYRKDVESGGEVAEGTVRWEAECRDWAKRYGEMRYFGDLTRESAESLARNRWEWSQMGAEVAGSMSRLVRAVSDCDYLTGAQKRSFLGYLCEQAAGIETTISSRTTMAKYRRLQRELGIVAPVDFGSMIEVVRRLDWESAREVVSVRAA